MKEQRKPNLGPTDAFKVCGQARSRGFQSGGDVRNQVLGSGKKIPALLLALPIPDGGVENCVLRRVGVRVGQPRRLDSDALAHLFSVYYC